MTRDRDFKDYVRARMNKTGESYTAARAQLTKPRNGEVFQKGTTEDGDLVFGMLTKLQTPQKGWSGLAVPSEYLGRRSRAWLRGTMNGHEFWVAAQPMGDGNHWVTVNRQMRAAMGLVGDEEVEVRFVIVDGPPVLAAPDDLTAALAALPAAKAAFERLSHNHRKEYLLWISEAKRDETRARRIAETVRRVTQPGSSKPD